MGIREAPVGYPGLIHTGGIDRFSKKEELEIFFNLEAFRLEVYAYKVRFKYKYSDIAAETGLYSGTVSTFFSGSRTPTLRALFLLSAWSDVSIDKYIKELQR